MVRVVLRLVVRGVIRVILKMKLLKAALIELEIGREFITLENNNIDYKSLKS